MVGLNDLNSGTDYVRGKTADYINDLIGLGVKGFRVDAAKHMWPGDIEGIQVYNMFVKYLTWNGLSILFFLFQSKVSDVDGKRPFFFHEVIDQGGEAVSMSEYFGVGKVTEFNAGNWMACIRDNDFYCLDG